MTTSSSDSVPAAVARDPRQNGASLFSTMPDADNFFEYGGACIDQSLKRVFLTGGGHHVTTNTVGMLDFGSDTPRWYQICPNSYAGTRVLGVNNGTGQYPTDIGTGRPAAFHTQHDFLCHNGYVWIPGMWGIGASGRTGSVTTQRFRMAANQAPGTTFVWEKLGVSAGTENDGFYFGEDGPVCLVESRNQIWRGGNDTTQSRDAINMYRIDSRTGAVIDRFTRGGAITVSGSKGTLPSGSARFNMYGLACEIHPEGGRPAMVLAYLNADSRPMGWYLFDVDSKYPTGSPSVYYGPLNVVNDTGVNILTRHMVYSCMRHLHGTQKIYMSYGDWKGSDGAYVTHRFMRLTIPAGTKAAALAAGTWVIDEVSPAGELQPPTSYVPQIAGKFNLVQDMGDGRPAVVNLVLPASTFRLRPHVWFLKMPAGGL